MWISLPMCDPFLFPHTQLSLSGWERRMKYCALLSRNRPSSFFVRYETLSLLSPFCAVSPCPVLRTYFGWAKKVPLHLKERNVQDLRIAGNFLRAQQRQLYFLPYISSRTRSRVLYMYIWYMSTGALLLWSYVPQKWIRILLVRNTVGRKNKDAYAVFTARTEFIK